MFHECRMTHFYARVSYWSQVSQIDERGGLGLIEDAPHQDRVGFAACSRRECRLGLRERQQRRY